MGDIANARITAIQLEDLVAAPATPSAGFQRLYLRGGSFYRVDSNGTEIPIGGANQNAGARLTMVVEYTLNDISLTVVQFDTENWDDGDFADLGINNDRITVPTGYAGLYVCTALITFWAVTGDVEMRLRVNGDDQRVIYQPANTTIGVTVQVTELLNLAEADYVQVAMYQTSGGAITVHLVTLMLQRLTGTQPPTPPPPPPG